VLGCGAGPVTGEFSTGIRQAERAERVLLVDDNPDNLQVLYQTLESRDYRLLIAKSGEDALGIAHKARPALILLDIMMPGMDGYEVCRRLKAEPATSDTPIILLSALGDTASKLRGFALGAVDYITKPFQAEEVIARVGTHLKIHRLEQRLSERNRILEVENQRILAAMGEGLYGLDCRGCITFANPAAARLTGLEEGALLGQDFQALHLHTRADGQAYPPDQGPVHTTLSRGEILHRDRDVFWCRDGSSFPVEYTCAPLREEGGVSGAVLVFKDITERRQAERRLQRIHEALVRSHRELGEAQQRLIQAAKLESVGRLAAGVAHEVKNPLAIIQLGLDYLAQAASVPEPGHVVLEDMGDAVRRADTVIKGLLVFSRAEPADMQIQDLNRVIHESLALVRHELVQRDIDLDLDLARGPAEVALDRGKMQQVFVNLFMNARSPYGCVSSG